MGLALAGLLPAGVRRIAGGPQAAFRPELLLASGHFDAVVRGYGEEAITAALEQDGLLSAPLLRGKDYRPDYRGIDLAPGGSGGGWPSSQPWWPALLPSGIAQCSRCRPELRSGVSPDGKRDLTDPVHRRPRLERGGHRARLAQSGRAITSGHRRPTPNAERLPPPRPFQPDSCRSSSPHRAGGPPARRQPASPRPAPRLRPTRPRR